MKKTFFDPNQEVEAWKDAFYNEFDKIPKSTLASYFEKKADQILKQYGIKCAAVKTILKQALVSA